MEQWHFENKKKNDIQKSRFYHDYFLGFTELLHVCLINLSLLVSVVTPAKYASAGPEVSLSGPKVPATQRGRI